MRTGGTQGFHLGEVMSSSNMQRNLQMTSEAVFAQGSLAGGPGGPLLTSATLSSRGPVWKVTNGTAVAPLPLPPSSSVPAPATPWPPVQDLLS